MSFFVFIIALIYAYSVNSFFGINWFPQSFEELVADGILAILFCIALIINVIERHVKSKEKSE